MNILPMLALATIGSFANTGGLVERRPARTEAPPPTPRLELPPRLLRLLGLGGIDPMKCHTLQAPHWMRAGHRSRKPHQLSG